MFDRIKTYIYQGNTFYGLEVSEVDANALFYLIKVKRKNAQLIIEGQSEHEHFDEVLKLLNHTVPMFLTINTSSVISKSFSNSKLRGEALANSVFPSLDYKNIWFESYRVRELGLVSIIKKKEVTHLLEKLKKAKIRNCPCLFHGK